jgi:hypothetical protein
VLSGGAATTVSAAIVQAIDNAKKQFVPVLPVFDPSHGFNTQIPTNLQAVNGAPWLPGTDPAAIAAKILRIVGLAESDRRIFLSYRRSDGTALADQLRYALIDDGWDVFLDKFSVPPAVHFQERLDRDLADKAFVLLLETPDAIGREWIEWEVAFALRNGLGLISAALPSTPKASLYGSVDPAFRHWLQAADMTGSVGSETLTPGALVAMLQRVDERHAAAFTLRRERLLLDTSAELHKRGCTVESIDEWTLIAEHDAMREVVFATARAPEAADVRAAHDRRLKHRKRSAVTRAWVVHPIEDIDIERASLLTWMCATRRVSTSPVMLLGDRVTA